MLNLVKAIHNATSFPKSNVSDLSSAEISVELDRLGRRGGSVVKRTLCSRRGPGPERWLRLRRLTALAEDLSLIPVTQSLAHKDLQLQFLGYPRLLASEGIVLTCTHPPTDSHIYIPLKNNTYLKVFKGT